MNTDQVYSEKFGGKGRVDEQMLKSVIQIDADLGYLATAVNDMGEIVYEIFLGGVAPGIGQG